MSPNTPTSAPTAGAGKSKLTPGEVSGQCDWDGSSSSSFPANLSPRMLRCYHVSCALGAAQILKQGSGINFSRDTRCLPDPAHAITWKAEELVGRPGLLACTGAVHLPLLTFNTPTSRGPTSRACTRSCSCQASSEVCWWAFQADIPLRLTTRSPDFEAI